MCHRAPGPTGSLWPPARILAGSHIYLKEPAFIALARANPGKFNCANSSTGSAGHFVFNRLRLVAGIDVVEIPFAGAAPANLAFAQGEVHTIMGSLLGISPNLQSGKAKPIGVASAERMEAFPNVPTFREQGIAVEWDTWYGMVAPANLPRERVVRISADMLSVMDDEEVRASMGKMGIARRLGGPDRMREAIRAEVENATRAPSAAGKRSASTRDEMSEGLPCDHQRKP